MQDNISEQPTAAPTPQTPPPPAGMTPPPKKNPQQLIGIVVVAVLILAGLIALVASLSSGDKKTGNTATPSSQEQDNEKQRQANAVTATSMLKLSAVCQVGSVTNAAEFVKPYKVAAFAKANDKTIWANVSLDSKSEYAVSYSDYEKVNVIACAQEKDGAAVKTRTCDFKSSDKTVSIDYYATKYDVAVYEAKSGKKIKNLGEVSAPATTCPIVATYDRDDPRITAAPDSDAINALVATFVAE